MSEPSAESNPLEVALGDLAQALDTWDPDDSPGVDDMLDALRELLVCIDPRKERAAAALSVVAMKLLEEIGSKGSVGAEAAIGAVGELASGLRETLVSGRASGPTTRTGRHAGEVTLSAPSKTGGTSGLSLALDVLQDQLIGEVLVKMGSLTREQVAHVLTTQAESGDSHRLFGEIAIELGYATVGSLESALRLQARGRGDVPPPAQGDDPWGSSAL